MNGTEDHYVKRSKPTLEEKKTCFLYTKEKKDLKEGELLRRGEGIQEGV